MKNIHFFGCSLTAGDELSDDEYFPWKSTCTSQFEYFERRNKILEDNVLSNNYELSNIKMAYPALIQNDEYTTYNHAKNGSSLKENIFNIMSLIATSNDKIDAIFLQVPPPNREMFVLFNDKLAFDKFKLTTLRISQSNPNPDLTRYINAKIISHNPVQSSLEDLMDLIFIANVVKQKNIKFCTIDISDQLKLRTNDLLKIPRFNFVLKDLDNEINLIHFYELIRRQISLGGHLTKQAHIDVAEEIKAMLPRILNS